MENNMRNEMKVETNMQNKLNLLENVELNGIDFKDAPDFVDAFVSYAELDGKALTDKELDEVNSYSDFVAELVIAHIY
jgi:argininosuccinate lyase